jgi:hypothetical protein
MLDRIVGRARVRLGKRLRFEGVPALMAGAAFIICAAGVAEALKRGATAFPDVIRETRELMLAARNRERRLPP